MSLRPQLLDVGGRKSHYTIALPADVTISDLPRESSVQKELDLGIDETSRMQTRARRNNVTAVLYDDMTKSRLAEATFEIVLAVEVLEHVERDSDFVANAWRVLKPGGVFIMTTPNGDFMRNTNPDHKRHYRKEQLRQLLHSSFSHVDIWYGIQDSRWRKLGLRSWSAKSPFRTLLGMLGNVINRAQSSSPLLRASPVGTCHLFGVAHKEHTLRGVFCVG